MPETFSLLGLSGIHLDPIVLITFLLLWKIDKRLSRVETHLKDTKNGNVVSG